MVNFMVSQYHFFLSSIVVTHSNKYIEVAIILTLIWMISCHKYPRMKEKTGNVNLLSVSSLKLDVLRFE